MGSPQGSPVPPLLNPPDLCWSEVHLPPDPSALPGMHGILDPDPELVAPKPADGKLVARPVLNGLPVLNFERGTTTTAWPRNCRDQPVRSQSS